MFGKKKKETIVTPVKNPTQEDIEFDIKWKVKQTKKETEKTIKDIEAREKTLIQQAATAKMKGYSDVYAQTVSLIKVARARKIQAEKFMFQVDAMQNMHELAKSSQDLLGNMSVIMDSLGKLSVDKAAIANNQREFAETQRRLEMQTANIENALGGLEMIADDVDTQGFAMDMGTIEDEIDSFILSSGVADPSTGASGAPAAGKAPSETAKYEKYITEN